MALKDRPLQARADWAWGAGPGARAGRWHSADAEGWTRGRPPEPNQSPKEMPIERAVWIRSESSGTVFVLPTTSLKDTGTMSGGWLDTILPNCPRTTSSTARAPNRVASTRS